MTGVQVLVLAKEPLPGRVKTRLSPPLTPEQAAAVARAALDDTLDAVRGCQADRRVLVADGDLRAEGFDVQPQVDGGLDERLAAAFADAWLARPLPPLLVGMDTPQVTAELLDQAVAALLAPTVDAVLGLAEDGGWWCLGLRQPRPGLLRGVPTSRPDTGRLQQERLTEAGLRVAALPTLCDVDTVAELDRVAAGVPHTRFGRLVHDLRPAQMAL